MHALVLVDDVASDGGATLALAGSRRVDMPGMSTASWLREVLETSGDLKCDLHQLGIDIAEMSARAGDVFLMGLRLLHTPSINSTKNVRMMATPRFLLDGPTTRCPARIARARLPPQGAAGIHAGPARVATLTGPAHRTTMAQRRQCSVRRRTC